MNGAFWLGLILGFGLGGLVAQEFLCQFFRRQHARQQQEWEALFQSAEADWIALCERQRQQWVAFLHHMHQGYQQEVFQLLREAEQRSGDAPLFH